MELAEKLLEIQKNLNAPKGNYNSFGGYKYRSAEDILSAVKPLCAEVKALLILSDNIEMIGERIYVKAAATLIDAEKPSDRIGVYAWAREPEQKKGMDTSQVTGATSSYARKYALNGLFSIDDTKDPDTDEYYRQTNRPAKKAAPKSGAHKLSEEKVLALQELIDEAGFTDTDVCKKYKVKSLHELPDGVYKMITKSLNTYIEEHNI